MTSKSHLNSQDLNLKKTTSFQTFNQIAASYDFLNRILSFGIDIYWRKILVQNLLKLAFKNNPRGVTPLKILDLATGTGDLAVSLVENSKGLVGEVIGIDQSTEMLKFGEEKINHKNLNDKIKLSLGDAVKIPFVKESFDGVTISFGIRNLPDPLESLVNMERVLKVGGVVSILEFGIPSFWPIKKLYLFYFRHLLPSIGGLFSKNKKAYQYLNETVEDFPYGEDFLNLMTKAQFKNVKYQRLTFGISYLYTGVKK
jgi:demethylmenaquinone methyltransferase/2-methoxy-6-polyprenyl-1,4-benzoquinol methylase